jgi:hypothetical protein
MNVIGLKQQIKAEVDRKELEVNMRAIEAERHEQIEMLSAAFLKQVGSAEASRYELVEKWEKQPDGSFLVHWFFQKRPEESRIVMR